MLMACVLGTMSISKADDKPISSDQLPAAARRFIEVNFPGEKISYATMDDDLFRPDYLVVLANGFKVTFDNSGRLEQVECHGKAIPSGIVPVQIAEYVKGHYPDAVITDYEVGRKTYEVKLSNRMELKFNSGFNIIEIDD